MAPARFDDSIKPLLDYVEQKQLDFTLSFAYLEAVARADQGACDLILQASPEIGLINDCDFVKTSPQAFSGKRVNPLVIPRNHQVEAVITAAEAGSWEQCHELFRKTTQPYSISALSHQDLRPAKPGDWLGRTFCGT